MERTESKKKKKKKVVKRLTKKMILGMVSSFLIMASVLSAAFNLLPIARARESPIEAWEDLTLDRDITFAGDGLIVRADSITLDLNGHIITGSGEGEGINLTNVSGVTIKNGEISNFTFGIFLSHSLHNTITKNTIANNNYEGIHTTDVSPNNTITENTITNNNYKGIYLGYLSNNNTIARNNVTNNGDGIFLASCSSNTIIGNNVTNNSFGIYLRKSTDNTITGNTITNNYDKGLNLYSSSNYNKIFGNIFVGDGLSIWDSSGHIVKDNIVNGKPLVYLEGVSNHVVGIAGQVILVRCNRVKVENLSLSHTDIGIQLSQTENTSISRNNITANDYVGIQSYRSSNNIIIENNITANYYVGIQLLSSSNNNSIFGNNVADNSGGIYFKFSNYNIITENSIANRGNGILFYNSSGNIIYSNNFINDALQVYDWSWSEPVNASINVWDDGCKGNYWWRYEGNDTDGNGIGDTPYLIDENNQDNYPLMGKWWNHADLNNDGTVNVVDLFIVAKSFQCQPEDLKWNCIADIDRNGIVNIVDLYRVAREFGNTL